MDLSTLSNLELENQLEKLTGVERETTLKVLFHLIELEKRAIYREAGYSSTFDYCTRKLKYSPTSACRRIAAARCLSELPEIGERFLKGEVTLCSIAVAAENLKSKETKLEEIVGRSAREVKMLVSQVEVPSKPKERVTPVKVSVPELPLAPKATEERLSLKFSVTKEVYSKFEETKALLSNSLGRQLTIEAVFSKLLEYYLEKPKAGVRRNLHTRTVPESLRREVFERDNGQCCFTATNGTRCTATTYLQIDHVIPHAAGGLTEIDNLRLLCSAHNRLLAEEHFGRAYVYGKIHKTLPPTSAVRLHK